MFYLGDLQGNIGLWILGAAALAAAIGLFYFGLIKKSKPQERLMEVLFIVLSTVALIWPLVSNINAFDGSYLAAVAIFVFFIIRVVKVFK